MKNHMRILILSLIYLPHSAIQAATANTSSISSSDHHSYVYNNLPSRNNFTFPIHVRNLTEHYGDTLTEASNRINAAFGHTAILDAPSVNPPYLNTIFLFEMNLANTAWLGVSLPYFVDAAGNPNACYWMTSWNTINQNNDLVGLVVNTSEFDTRCAGSIAASLPNQTNPALGTVKSGLNAGMIVFNNYVYGIYTPATPFPPFNDRLHLVMHEYGHYSGGGHITDTNLVAYCTNNNAVAVSATGSIMIPRHLNLNETNTLTVPGDQICAAGPPTRYSVDDVEVMRFEGF